MSDEEDMLAYKSGDRAAFSRIVGRHWGSVYRFLRRLLRNDALAEESLAETFYKLHKHAPHYEPVARFTTYLYTIAYHEALTIMRQQKKEAGVFSMTHFDDDSELELPDSELNPERRYLQRLDLELIDEAIDRLPERQRAVFLLYYREHLETPEIARVLDAPAGTVRTFLCRARAAILNALRAGEHEQLPAPVG